jgi:hypothetical protein
MRLATVLFTVSWGIVFAQGPAVPNAGIASEWEFREKLSDLVADVGKIEPLLQRVQPTEWTQKGAPSAYIKQLQSAQATVQHLVRAAEALSKSPEKLTIALDLLFRMEKMEFLLASLRDGARRYGDPAIADEMTSLFATNSIHRDRLRQYVVELAAVREQEFALLDREAQRCRAQMSQQATTPCFTPDQRKPGKQSK